MTRRRRQQQQQQQNQQQPHDSRFPTLSSRFGNDEFFNRPFGAFPNPFVDQSSSPARDTASPQPTQPPIDPSLPKIYKTQANIYPEPSQTQTNPSGVPIRVEHVGGRSDFKCTLNFDFFFNKKTLYYKRGQKINGLTQF